MTNPTQQTDERETIRMTVHTTWWSPVLCIHGGGDMQIKSFVTEEEAIAFANGYAMGRGCDLDLIES